MITPPVYFPLPTTAVLLRGFRAGAPAAEDVCPSIVQTGAALVDIHQRRRTRERRIRAYVAERLEDGHRWACVVEEERKLRGAIAQAVAGIDAAVRVQRRPDAGFADAIWLTETVGAVIARLAGLWVASTEHRTDAVDLRAVRELNALCVGYSCLIEGLTAGALRVPEHTPEPYVPPA